MGVQFNKRKETDLLVIHCAATRPNMDVGVREIRQWHKQRGFLDIGYHAVIRRDGTIEQGRDINAVGSHAKGFNAKSIGVCLVGGVDDKLKPQDNFTPEQYAALDVFVKHTLESFPTIKQVVGHRDLDAGKACPSFDAKARYAE